MTRILIADDHPDAADSLAMLLQFLGYETKVVYDGRQAVDACDAFQPDLVILDINMPVMDGYEAARTIRGARGNRVILAAITGAPQWETRAKAAACGFDEHLAKPVQPAELEGLIQRVLPVAGNA